MNGDLAEGISILRTGSTGVRATGAELWMPYYTALLARACELAGFGGKSDRLRITPPVCRLHIGERIIEDRAPGNPDPVGRDTLPAVRPPSESLAVWRPMRRHRPAVPLADVTGCWVATNCPRVPARTCPSLIRNWTVGVCGNRHGHREYASQAQSERPHLGSPVTQWALAPVL
jgi:hypothetical protein